MRNLLLGLLFVSVGASAAVVNFQVYNHTNCQGLAMYKCQDNQGNCINKVPTEILRGDAPTIVPFEYNRQIEYIGQNYDDYCIMTQNGTTVTTQQGGKLKCYVSNVPNERHLFIQGQSCQ